MIVILQNVQMRIAFVGVVPVTAADIGKGTDRCEQFRMPHADVARLHAAERQTGDASAPFVFSDTVFAFNISAAVVGNDTLDAVKVIHFLFDRSSYR